MTLAAAQGARGQQAGSGASVTVRGTVVSTANGKPVRRALVKVQSNPEQGAITDETGRFEIQDVPEGLLNFSVSKPGYREAADLEGPRFPQTHLVRVGSGMPDLAFSLIPDVAISGHIALSSDVPAQGIGLILMRKTIVDGEAAWQRGEWHQTNPDGNFRFSGVMDGTYLLWTQPAFENSDAMDPRCNDASPANLPGFAAQYYSDSRDMAGAEDIVVGEGQSAEVSLSLRLTMLHLVQVKIVGAGTGKDQQFTITLSDPSGQAMDYPVHLEDRTVCAYLPDGSYSVSAVGVPGQDGDAPGERTKGKRLMGSVSFSVEGQPARDLRLVLGPVSSTPVSVRFVPGPPPPIGPESPTDKSGKFRPAEPLNLYARRAGVSINQWAGATRAFEAAENTLELEGNLPGAYEIGASVTRCGVCLGSVTAGGQDLAEVPWIVGPSGAGTPIDVQLRTDCASLTLQMPMGLGAGALGEGATFFVYVVPAFHSAGPIAMARLDQFGDRSVTLKDLTPGTYRIFTYRKQRAIEFRNAAALDQLGPGQVLTLDPGGNATLTVEESPR